MPLTAAEIQAILDNLNAAMLSVSQGEAESVSIRGRTVVIRDTDKLLRLINYYENLLARITSGNRPAVIRFTRSAGTF